MKAKKAYVCSENTDYVLEMSSYWPLFNEVNKIITSTPGVAIGEDKLGQVDFVVKGEDNTLILLQAKRHLNEKLARFEAPEYPSSIITLFDRKYELDVRNDEHMMINSLGRWYKMLQAEEEKKGAVLFYNMSPVDDANGRILVLLKKNPQGLDFEDVVTQINTTYKSYALPVEELRERFSILQEHHFIIAKETVDSMVKWFPSEKTTRITSIY